MAGLLMGILFLALKSHTGLGLLYYLHLLLVVVATLRIPMTSSGHSGELRSPSGALWATI